MAPISWKRPRKTCPSNTAHNDYTNALARAASPGARRAGTRRSALGARAGCQQRECTVGTWVGATVGGEGTQREVPRRPAGREVTPEPPGQNLSPRLGRRAHGAPRGRGRGALAWGGVGVRGRGGCRGGKLGRARNFGRRRRGAAGGRRRGRRPGLLGARRVGAPPPPRTNNPPPRTNNPTPRTNNPAAPERQPHSRAPRLYGRSLGQALGDVYRW